MSSLQISLSKKLPWLTHLLRAAFSTTEKKEYISAMQCLTTAAPITPLSVVPGVRSRFDDFAALHINQTAIIHWTVSTLLVKDLDIVSKRRMEAYVITVYFSWMAPILYLGI